MYSKLPYNGQLTDDPSWAENVVKTLAKRLKKAKYLDDFAKAIITEQRLSNCCTIPNENDKKRPHRKDRSHILYIKMWRFPWVKSHQELKAVDNCRYPFSKKADLICVNPYHYEPIHAKAPHEMRGHYLSEESSPTSSYVGSPSCTSPTLGFPGPSSSAALSSPASNASTAAPPSAGPPQAPLSPTAIGNSPQAQSPLSPNSYLSEDRDEHEMMDTTEDRENTLTSNFLRPPGADMVQELVEYCEPECWMSITYYEEGKRIGDPFNVRSHYLLVDGYPSPSSEERFCLGYFDVENRPITVIDARRQVGRGARFYYIGGEIPPNCNLKIFNNAEFAAQLAESVEKGYEAVFALTRLCTIRMSFVKGWGADYRRQTIDATPCWIEAHLNGPLLWIDRVLRSMGAPMMAHSSFT
ncbi:unnamed protein product [Nippostrongylus brasiliensis]|uniref:Mothers against decapentaplegic homolog n=1 Tax=Nippostrongylus brasiliensis TaxID=27835 RepID=A0A0N4YSQ1_NIPBR|nr:unnamed protein product [Nippostrongylus brasiliensis]